MRGERGALAGSADDTTGDAASPDIANPRPGSVWRDPVVWVIAAAVFGAYFVISLFRLLRLAPTSWDLAIYTEYVKQLAAGRAPVVDVRGAGFNLLGDHFQVALAVLAPFFRLVPSPATLLFFQAALTALSVFGVAAAASALTGRTGGRLIGFAYGFSWGLQQMIDFDFHEIALAVPLLAFSLSALVRRRPLAAICWALPLVFVKEDQGFTVAAIGLLLGISAAFPPRAGGWQARTGCFTGVDGRYREDNWGDGRVALWGGLFLMAWGLFWSVLAITVIIPHFNPSHVYYYWKDGGVVGNQSFSLGGLIGQTASGWQVKLQTVVLLLLPTAFAALGSPLALLALPSLVLRFMSTNTAYWGTSWHYNATLMPILFIAAAEAVARQRAASGPPPFGTSGFFRALGVFRAGRTGISRHGPAMMAAVSAALAFQFPLSSLWQGSTYQLGAHVQAADAAMAVVPDGATVQATLDLLAPLAARTDTYWIGNSGNPATQYIVFDNADSGYSPAVTDVSRLLAMLYPGVPYTQVFERGDVYVFRRG